jgi:hypothetical protein
VADSRQVRQIIRRIHSDPALLEQLVSARNDDQRKRILEERNVVAAGGHGPTREEAEEEISKLLGRPLREAGEERRAEDGWVAAIGTAAAGAAAAFCAAE